MPAFPPDPAPPPSPARPAHHAAPTDWDAFLRERLPTQVHAVESHIAADGTRVWLKRAAPVRGPGRHRAMALLAGMLGLPVLRPVPTPGGAEGIATEVRRLRAFSALGLRVPEVLAFSGEGLLTLDLGRPEVDTHSLGNEIEHHLADGPGAVLALWRQGLSAIAQVHARGTCLSQAFARNLVRCPDGVVGYLDFEDDPAATLPLPVCQVRDLLCYAHSTALYLRASDTLAPARAEAAAWTAAHGPEFRQTMDQALRRLAWLRRLPQDRRWGRDVQRIRAAYDLLAP
ncbi:hypothetical protein C7Y68_02340 [Paracidovorax avenae]|uniref:hypothetical protein n=1 Tax=Paracidovorax avenae TaxID=80867 RepID=UPI000D1551F8|nr:hypothetical protein [Paracidovorax avenae]AVS97779.1 hypothetical protein C8236_02320 [Paracidovorax avenae]AVT18969.1 hypothetical protein C7Y68_02340 [Paracidovorax avenae]